MDYYLTNTQHFEELFAVGEHYIYGSSRVGSVESDHWLRKYSFKSSYSYLTNTYTQKDSITDSLYKLPLCYRTLTRGLKRYEMSNHLGNVLAVISDQWRSICSCFGTEEEYTCTFIRYEATVVQATDYSAFGAPLPGRTYTLTTDVKYRFGFQGQEEDREFWEGAVGYKFRVEDARLGRFFSVDPLWRKYPGNSSYAFSENRVISMVELEGLECVDPQTGQSGPWSPEHMESQKSKGKKGTDPNEGMWMFLFTYRHHHNDAINGVYEMTGGDAQFNKQPSPGSIGTLQASSNGAVQDLTRTKSGVAFNEYTNTEGSNLFVSPSTVGTETGWINYMLGHFVKGTGPENYIFPVNGQVSNYMRSSQIVERAILDYENEGMPNIYTNKQPFGFTEQVNIFTSQDRNMLSIENFVGSADITIQKMDDNCIMVTIINVTSLTSGDYFKHDPGHAWPTSTVRNQQDQSPQPYSNTSQTYRLTFDIRKSNNKSWVNIPSRQ